jgi:hypothetical protein
MILIIVGCISFLLVVDSFQAKLLLGNIWTGLFLVLCQFEFRTAAESKRCPSSVGADDNSGCKEERSQFIIYCQDSAVQAVVVVCEALSP